VAVEGIAQEFPEQFLLEAGKHPKNTQRNEFKLSNGQVTRKTRIRPGKLGIQTRRMGTLCSKSRDVTNSSQDMCVDRDREREIEIERER
jgi:hypothetical protein